MTRTSWDGWYVPTPLRIAAIAVCLPAVFGGALLSVSVFFTPAGAPLLVVAIMAIRGIARAPLVGAAHPAWPFVGLATIETSWGVLAHLAGGSDIALVSGAFLASGVITTVTAVSLTRSTLPYAGPPPPQPPSWTQSCGRLS